MREELKDYFSGAEWKEFISNISKLLNLSICNFIISYDEKIQSSINENPLCLELRKKPEGIEWCKKMYDEHLLQIEDKGKPQVFYCHASLARVLMPIKFENSRFVLIMCGIRCKLKPKGNWEILKNLIKEKEFNFLYKKLSYIPFKRLVLSSETIHFLFKNIIELILIKENLKKLI